MLPLKALLEAAKAKSPPVHADSVEAAFVAEDWKAVVRLFASRDVTSRPEIYGFAKAMLGHNDAWRYLTLGNAGEHLLARTMAAESLARSWKTWGGQNVDPEVLERVRAILKEAEAAEELTPLLAEVVVNAWRRAFYGQPPLPFLERAHAIAGNNEVIATALVRERRALDRTSESDAELLMGFLPSLNHRVVDDAIDLAFLLKNYTLLEAALSSIDETEDCQKEILRCFFATLDAAEKRTPVAQAIEARIRALATRPDVAEQHRIALLLAAATYLHRADVDAARLYVKAAWAAINAHDGEMIYDPWVAVTLSTFRGDRIVTHVPLHDRNVIRELSKGRACEGAQACGDLYAFYACSALSPSRTDVKRVRKIDPYALGPALLSTAMQVELDSKNADSDRVAALIVQAAKLVPQAPGNAVLHELLEDVRAKPAIAAAAVETACSIGMESGVSAAIRDAWRQVTGTTAADAPAEMTIIEAATLVGLFRAPVDHVAMTVGPLSAADQRFEPEPQLGEPKIRALFKLMDRGFIAPSPATPPRVITEKDGKTFYILSGVIWRFNEKTISELTRIRSLTPQQWPDSWRSSLPMLLLDLGAQEVYEYLNHCLGELGLDPLEDQRVVEIIKDAFENGKSIAHAYYIAHKVAKDTLAYKQKYRSSAKAVESRALKLLEQTVANSIEKGWVNSYRRISELPESILFDVLHRTFARRGTAAFEDPFA